MVGCWSLLGIWYLVLKQGTAWAESIECGSERYKVNTKEGSKCCKQCVRGSISDPCPNANSLPEECRCSPGYACTGDPCKTCIQLPICGKNEAVKRTGKFDFLYNCTCQSGTKKVNGSCRSVIKIVSTPSWMDKVLNTNSATSEAQYTTSSVAEKRTKAPDSFFDGCSYLAIYTSLSIFVLLILSVLLHFFICKLKTGEQIRKTEVHELPHMVVSLNSKEDPDTCSCQYPEEEHGDTTMDKWIPMEKASMDYFNEEKPTADHREHLT